MAERERIVSEHSYAIINGEIRKVKLCGGVFRDGRHFTLAVLHNPKKQKSDRLDEPQRMLIDPLFIASTMDELKDKLRQLPPEAMKALTNWTTQ